MALPMLHVLAKTSIELRRSIFRLENFIKTNPTDLYVPKAQELLELLTQARNTIPYELKDRDLG